MTYVPSWTSNVVDSIQAELADAYRAAPNDLFSLGKISVPFHNKTTSSWGWVEKFDRSDLIKTFFTSCDSKSDAIFSRSSRASTASSIKAFLSRIMTKLDLRSARVINYENKRDVSESLNVNRHNFMSQLTVKNVCNNSVLISLTGWKIDKILRPGLSRWINTVIMRAKMWLNDFKEQFLFFSWTCSNVDHPCLFSFICSAKKCQREFTKSLEISRKLKIYENLWQCWDESIPYSHENEF